MSDSQSHNDLDDKSLEIIERFLAKQLLLVGGYEADDNTIEFVIWASSCSANTQVLIEELLDKAIEEGNV